ncbi:hypothetical protein [Enterococcus faecium]|uniref:hypothetical protein n=1 Tax=Enterococcus faecium TaxID=1352 RepID=UPI00295445C1|nr:hypothetical protein [Enterococcus faecium]MDV7750677.1 hypothetical protein [Enterococcus faecium]
MEAHLFLISIIYFIFSIIAFGNEARIIKYSRVISMVDICKLMYLLLNVVIPLIIYLGYVFGGITSSSIRYSNDQIYAFYMGALYTILGYVCFSFGCKIKQRTYYQHEYTTNAKLLVSSTIFLVISVVSLIIWASGFGGVSQLILKANSIRAGFITGSNNRAFFKHFVQVSMISSLTAFYYLFLSKDTDRSLIKKIYAFLLFILSTIITILYIVANDGRMLAGIFIMMFLLLIIKVQYEENKASLSGITIKLLIISVITIILIFNADTILAIFRGGITSTVAQRTGVVEKITNEFSFIITGLSTSISQEHLLTFGNDLINGIFAWLPTSLKPIILQDVWDYNTHLLNTGVYGQSPTSIVAQSIYDLDMIGIVIIPTVYGFVVKKIQNIADRYQDVFFKVIYILLGFYLGKGMAYFSVYNIMMNTFFVFFACIVYFFVNKTTIGSSK